MQSRYYDPAIGRFITSDGIYIDIGNILSNNLYAYCYNSPILYYDSNGRKPIIRGLYISDEHENENFRKHWDIYGFYIEISDNISINHDVTFSIFNCKIGVAKVRWDSGKVFTNMSENSIFNPNIYVELDVVVADGNIGFGGASGKIAVFSGLYGFQLGDTVSINLELYLGIGGAFDFTDGIKVGAPGWEISIEFDWNELLDEIFG